MKEKINIAELLKDCPKGMELDCTAFNNVKFQCADNDGIWIEYIDSDNHDRVIYLTCGGGIKIQNIETKCVIFPKGKTTWEGFVPPCQFKDGDVVCYSDCIAIFKEWGDETLFRTYVTAYLHGDSAFDVVIPLFGKSIRRKARLATEEEKAKLFDAIKANGYKWNPETKTLEKLVEPKFKAGDKIEKCGYRFTIAEIKDDDYLTECGNKIPFDNQDDFSLVPNKFDIATLKPFDKVLVRDSYRQIWAADFFSHNIKESFGGYAFACIGHCWHQCIPYEGNEHLLGTTDDCDEYFKTWE